MRRSRLRPFVVAGIAIISTMAMSVAGVLAHDRPDHSTKPQSGGSLVVAGNVAQKLRLSVPDLAAMPNQKTVEVTFRAGDGTEHRIFTGPLLLDVLARAAPQFDPTIKNDSLRHFVSVTAGSDGYRALVAYGELDPSFEDKQILLAVTQDGASLAKQGPRLVVPGDIAGGRYVTGVSTVRLDKPRR